MELVASEISNEVRKRSRNPHKWKKNLAKIERYSSKQAPKITCDHNSKAYNCNSLKQEDIQSFHDMFYTNKTKANQDEFILKYCSTSSIQRRRPTTCDRTSKIFQTKCFVPELNTKCLVPVCQKSFLSVLCITRPRLNYIMKIFHEQGKPPVERRGGDHCSHKNELKKSAVESFLSSVKCVESHYSRIQTNGLYVSSELTIKKLFEIYNENSHPELKVKQSCFRSIFKSKFNQGFKLPRVDVCTTCTELSDKINRCMEEILWHKSECTH